MESTEFYRDYGDSQVERLAKAIIRKRGAPHPDVLIPESGYPNARSIPAWWMAQDAARDFLACIEEYKTNGKP